MEENKQDKIALEDLLILQSAHYQAAISGHEKTISELQFKNLVLQTRLKYNLTANDELDLKTGSFTKFKKPEETKEDE